MTYRVLAPWSDGRFYPGHVKNSGAAQKNKLKVYFDDGVKRMVRIYM